MHMLGMTEGERTFKKGIAARVILERPVVETSMCYIHRIVTSKAWKLAEYQQL